MRKGLWWRFGLACVGCALLLSVFYYSVMREIVAQPQEHAQQSIYLFLARIAEQGPYAQSLRRIEGFSAESPGMVLDLWVVSADGRVLAATVEAPPPLGDLPLPARIHEFSLRGRFFAANPALAVIRLDAPDPTYLVVRKRAIGGRSNALLLSVFFMITLTGAVASGLLLATYYLRGRSRRAREVIARLQGGDLSARFEAGRLDEIGGLMLDFNRMADEIERLVTRLQTTERTRRELLQELGHDLRTPLTSLRTAIDTLVAHGAAMTHEERAEFLKVAAGELAYFGKLTEDLFFIAEIDEPRYRKHAEAVDLERLLAGELDAARAAQRAGVATSYPDILLLCDGKPAGTTCVAGDAYLLGRLFRNALDNALRHARTRVSASIVSDGGKIEVRIENDGPGMSPEAIAGFGVRRNRRLVEGSVAAGASLGLGSVIMRAIVELHGGVLSIASPGPGDTEGTRLTIVFAPAPLSERSA